MPAKKPRTECCCHPVDFMIAAIVVPLGRLSSPRTVSCLVPPRLQSVAAFPLLSAFLARLAGATFVFPTVLRCDTFKILWLRRQTRRHHRSPTVAVSPAGRDPRRGKRRPHQPTTLTLCLQRKSS